jgi:hypothetical protein
MTNLLNLTRTTLHSPVAGTGRLVAAGRGARPAEDVARHRNVDVVFRFARDSPLEGDGFELLVPRQRLHPSATANHLSSHRLPRKLGLRFASDWDGPSFASCRNAGVVARAFPMSRRYDALSFTHHAEVASLKPEPVDELLRQGD